MRGKVKVYNCQKSWGFIIGEDRKKYFVHYSQVISPHSYKVLFPRQVVTFTPLDTPRGPQAQNVRVIEDDLKKNSALEKSGASKENIAGEGKQT